VAAACPSMVVNPWMEIKDVIVVCPFAAVCVVISGEMDTMAVDAG
jgi:hypothetical protein